MGWLAAAAALIPPVVGAISGNKGAKSADRAAAAEERALERSIELGEQRLGEAQQLLMPYVGQEAAANQQLMAQMGLPGGGGAPAYMGGGGGAPTAGAGAPGGFQTVATQRQHAAFVNEMLTNAISQYGRAGYGSAKKADRAIELGAEWVMDRLEKMKDRGEIPPNFELPSQADLLSVGSGIVEDYGGLKPLRETTLGDYFSRGKANRGKPMWFQDQDAFTAMSEKYFGAPDTWGGGTTVQPGGPGGPLPPGQFMGGAGAAPAAPGAQTVSDIMERAGMEGIPPELRERYMTDLMEDPRTDPELAAYLGLTPESMDVGASYQQSPAYMRAIEAGTEAVDAGAAAGGSLYSGRRGEALRDVGAGVERDYYMDAMNRRQLMMDARRRERARGITERGGEVARGRARESEAYTNYMNLLADLASPTTTTNLANMGTSLAAGQSANVLGTARSTGRLMTSAGSARQAQQADFLKGLGKAAEAFLQD